MAAEYFLAEDRRESNEGSSNIQYGKTLAYDKM